MKVDATDDDVDEVEGSDDELLFPAPQFSIVDPDQELADSLHVDLGWLARCTDLLRDRPQLIFYGPPGAGKTYIAKDVGSASRRPGLPSPSRVFQPAYSYEDFFEGFRLAKIFGELYFLLEYRDEAIDLMFSSGDAELFTRPRNVVVIFRDRAPRTVRSPSWTRRCAAASDSFRCSRRRSPRNLLLRRWALRPHVSAACRGSAPRLECCD